MSQQTAKTFMFEDEEYEIRIMDSGWERTVKVFKNGEAANGYSYSVSLPTAFDLRKINGTDAVQELVKSAEEDIKNKLWEKYVTAYLAKQKITEKDLIGCRKCTSRDVVSSVIDERKMYECQKCNNIWYDERKVTNGYCSIVDSITDDVSEKGSHEVDAEILLNTIFRNLDKAGPCFEDQLKNWANMNKLQFQNFQKDVNGESRPYIKFWR